MAGHNKWSSIKHRKAAQDSKRGAAFNKLIRELVVAAREGGPDPETNYALSAAIDKAKGANMPKDNIERAIKRGAGNDEADNYERITYEGRGPGGTAMIVTTLTDNKNRTVAAVRHIFSKNGGSMEANGSVSWMFERKGVVTLEFSGQSEDDLLLACAEAGAEDYSIDGDSVEVFAELDELQAVKEWFDKAEAYKVQSSELSMVPKDSVEVDNPAAAKQLLRLLDLLDDNDDVQNVYSNFSMSDEVMETAAG